MRPPPLPPNQRYVNTWTQNEQFNFEHLHIWNAVLWDGISVLFSLAVPDQTVKWDGFPTQFTDKCTRQIMHAWLGPSVRFFPLFSLFSVFCGSETITSSGGWAVRRGFRGGKGCESFIWSTSLRVSSLKPHRIYQLSATKPPIQQTLLSPIVHDGSVRGASEEMQNRNSPPRCFG